MASTGDSTHGQPYQVLRLAKGPLSRQVRAIDVTFVTKIGLRVSENNLVVDSDFAAR